MVWPFPKGIVIRMHRVGCANRPFYQIGMGKKRDREGAQLEEVFGSCDSMPNEKGEVVASIDLKRVAFYLGKGADMSKSVEAILGLAGFIPLHPRLYHVTWDKRKKKLEWEEKYRKEKETNE